MDFMIHSSKTGKWLQRIESDTSGITNIRAGWVDDIRGAKKFNSPAEAKGDLDKLSEVAKAHIVLFDGTFTWNVNLSKAH